MLLMEFNTVTRKQIPLCEYHELDEGWKTKLGGLALAAAMAFNAMNPSKVDNNEVFVYMDTAGKTHTVTQMNDIPSDAQFKFKINTTAKDVAALDKSGKEIPVEVEPSSPEQFTPEVDAKSGFFKTVDPKYKNDPFGGLTSKHSDWKSPSGSSAKIRIIDTKPLPSDKNITVVLTHTVFPVVPLTGGIYKGLYPRSDAENSFSIRAYNLDKEEVYSISHSFSTYNELDLASMQTNFDKIDSTIKPKHVASKYDSFDVARVYGLVNSDKQDELDTNQKFQKSKQELSDLMRHMMSGTWDGSYKGANEYIKQRLHDPRSYDYVSTVVIGTSKTGTMGEILVTYRAKNKMGGLVKQDIILNVNRKGEIFSHSDKSSLM